MRQVSRRSFIYRVTGSAVIGGSAFFLLSGRGEASLHPPRRGSCSDADVGPRSDPANNFYGDRDAGLTADPLRQPRTIRDRDAGANADGGPRSIGRCGSGKTRPRSRGRRSEAMD